MNKTQEDGRSEINEPSWNPRKKEKRKNLNYLQDQERKYRGLTCWGKWIFKQYINSNYPPLNRIETEQFLSRIIYNTVVTDLKEGKRLLQRSVLLNSTVLLDTHRKWQIYITHKNITHISTSKDSQCFNGPMNHNIQPNYKRQLVQLVLICIQNWQNKYNFRAI